MKVDKTIKGLIVSGVVLSTALLAYKVLAASEDEIKLTNLTMPDQIQLGDEVSISVEARNMTGATKIAEVACIVDGQLVGFESVILQPRQSATLVFSFTPLEAGTYSVSVDGLTRNIEVSPSALFSLSPITWDAPMPFKPSSDHIFSLMFKNTSGQYYFYRLEWTFGAVYGTAAGRVKDKGGVLVSDLLYMPEDTGLYDLPLKVTIDGVFMGEFVVSTVEVV